MLITQYVIANPRPKTSVLLKPIEMHITPNHDGPITFLPNKTPLPNCRTRRYSGIVQVMLAILAVQHSCVYNSDSMFPLNALYHF